MATNARIITHSCIRGICIMKTWIYITGISGGLLLVFWLIGTLTEFPWNDWLLGSGLMLLGFICMPLSFIDRYCHLQNIEFVSIEEYAAISSFAYSPPPPLKREELGKCQNRRLLLNGLTNGYNKINLFIRIVTTNSDNKLNFSIKFYPSVRFCFT